ncbi:hypothetical protein Tco_1176139 [Tanacetum coccineum]
MANLKYSYKHNMVAFLKKPNESVGFTEVVDFLKGTSLRGYAGDFVPLLPAMLAGAAMDQGDGSAQPAEPYHTPYTTQGIDGTYHTPVDPLPSTSLPPMEIALKRKSKKVLVSALEGEELEDQERIIQDIDDDPLVSLFRDSMKEKSTDFVTPKKASGEAQEEEISPTILEAAKTLSKVASQSVCNKAKEGKAQMVEEDIQATHKTKEQIGQEEAGLEKAIRLQAQMDEEVVKQIHLDKMVAKRVQEEQELVHCLNLESADICMLTERRYPLPADVCQAMLNKKLQGDKRDEACYQFYDEVDKDCLSVGFATTQQMVISSPCLTDIKNWLVQSKRLCSASTLVSTGRRVSIVSLVVHYKLVLVIVKSAYAEARIRRIFFDGYGVLVSRIVIFEISSFKLQNARLLLTFTNYFIITAILKYKRLRGYKATTIGFYHRNNANPSYQERRQSMEETLSKFIGELAKRHEENSNLIKEIRASTDAAIRNQGASIKTLEIQIGRMSKVLQERGFGSLSSSTKTNLRDHVKSISTTIEADASSIRRIGSHQYAVSTG